MLEEYLHNWYAAVMSKFLFSYYIIQVSQVQLAKLESFKYSDILRNLR